jgi:hypothetical protein
MPGLFYFLYIPQYRVTPLSRLYIKIAD